MMMIIIILMIMTMIKGMMYDGDDDAKMKLTTRIGR